MVALTVVTVALSAGTVRTALGPFGPPVDTLVATRPLEAGTAIDTYDVAPVRRPRDVTPPDALATLSDAVGRTVHVPVVAGGVVTDQHVTAAGISGLVPPDSVAVPMDPALVSGVPVGTRLDLVARDATMLATGALVIARTDDVVWVAVATARAAPVAAAASSGALTVAVHPAEGVAQE